MSGGKCLGILAITVPVDYHAQTTGHSKTITKACGAPQQNAAIQHCRTRTL